MRRKVDILKYHASGWWRDLNHALTHSDGSSVRLDSFSIYSFMLPLVSLSVK